MWKMRLESPQQKNMQEPGNGPESVNGRTIAGSITIGERRST